ncbi:MAG: hypothetical protein ACTSXY_09050 [Promethearchaeota archaeon]
MLSEIQNRVLDQMNTGDDICSFISIINQKELLVRYNGNYKILVINIR